MTAPTVTARKAAARSAAGSAARTFGFCAATAVGLCALVATGASAQTLDDGKGGLFDAAKSLVGAGIGLSDGDDGKAAIEYRDRPALVLPKDRSQLPSPQQRQRSAAWPVDPDVARRKAEARAPVRSQSDSDVLLSQKELQAGRGAGVPAGRAAQEEGCRGKGGDVCVWMDPTKLRTTGILKEETRTPVGSEPERNWLVEPPKGYRRVTQATGSGKIAPRKMGDKDEANPLGFFTNPFRKDDDE